jgi:hypothetical protein
MCQGTSGAHAAAMFTDYDTLRALADERRRDLVQTATRRPGTRRPSARRWWLRRR